MSQIRCCDRVRATFREYEDPFLGAMVDRTSQLAISCLRLLNVVLVPDELFILRINNMRQLLRRY